MKNLYHILQKRLDTQGFHYAYAEVYQQEEIVVFLVNKDYCACLEFC